MQALAAASFLFVAAVVMAVVAASSAHAQRLLVSMAGDESGPGIHQLEDGAFAPVLSTPARAPSEIAIDANAGMIYWIEGGDRFDVGGALRRAALDGTGAETVARANVLGAEAFADVAWHEGALYVIDFDTKFSRQPPRLLRIDPEGGAAEVLVEEGLSEPTALAVSAAGLVWVDEERIMRAGLDGSSPEVLHTDAERTLRDVALHDGQVYWIDLGYSESGQETRLMRAALDGIGSTELMNSNAVGDLDTAVDLAVDDERIVWFSEGMFDEYTIAQADLDGSGAAVVPLGSFAFDGFRLNTTPKVKDLALAGGSLYLTDQKSHNIIQIDASGRSGLLFAPLVFGMTALTADAAAGMVYWADGLLGINQVKLDGTDDAIIIPQAANQTIQSMAFDPDEGLIYWASREQGITRAAPDRSVFENVVPPGGEADVAPIYAALDRSNDRIYWMNGDGRVMRAAQDGSAVEVIASGIGTPGPIAVDPANDALYWVDRGSFSGDPPPQMVRARLDGSGAEVLPAPVSSGTIGLGVDAEAGLLYWDNMERGAVFQSNLDGTEAEPLVTVRHAVRALTFAP